MPLEAKKETLAYFDGVSPTKAQRRFYVRRCDYFSQSDFDTLTSIIGYQPYLLSFDTSLKIVPLSLLF